MEVSLFKLLSETHPQAVVYLEYQYRMHKSIMAVSNHLVYNNRLKCANDDVSEKLLDLPNFATLRRDILSREDRGMIKIYKSFFTSHCSFALSKLLMLVAV